MSRWESLLHTNIHVPYPDVIVCQTEPLSEETRIVWVPVSKTSTIALFYPSRRSTTLSSSQLLLQTMFGAMNDSDLLHRAGYSLLAVRLILVMEPAVPYCKDIVELVMQRIAMAMNNAASTARFVNRVELQIDRSVWFDRTADGSHALDVELVSAVWTKKLQVIVAATDDYSTWSSMCHPHPCICTLRKTMRLPWMEYAMGIGFYSWSMPQRK
jgi:hypothetical protein